MPNILLSRKEVELEIHQLEHNILAQDVRCLQLEDEARRIKENQEATRKAIADLEEKLAKLIVIKEK